MTRAAIYIRVSTEGQAEKGFSLQEQRASLTAFCASKGMTLIEIVEDAGISGTDTERPGIQRLEELIVARVVDVIVAAKIDRLSRLAWFGERFIQQARARGVEVTFADQKFDATPVGDFTRHVMAGVAQLDHAQITERMQRGKLQKAKERKVMPVGKAPFGYRQVSKAQAEALPEYAGRDGELVLEEEEAAVVREVFRRYVEGEGLATISEWLLAHPAMSGRGYWEYGRIKGMLRHEAYKGDRWFNRRKWHKHRQVAVRDPEEWILLPCPAIVTPEVWEAARQRMDATATGGRPSADFLLRGLVFCATCKGRRGLPVRCTGQRMSHAERRAGYNRRYYRCNSQGRLLEEFCGASARAEDLERIVLKQARSALKPGRMAALAAKAAAKELRAAGNVEAEISNLTVQLQQLDREEHRVMDLALTGFSETVVRDRLASIKQRRGACEKLLAVTKDQAQRRAALAEGAVEAEFRAAAALQRLNEADARGDLAAMREVLAQFFRVYLKADHAPRVELIMPGITG